MNGTIELKGLHFHARHGCFDFEREKGGEYTVDFSGELDITRATASDNLADTVDLAAVYHIIAHEMDIPSNLIEHVAARIAGAVKQAFPQFLTVTVKLTKQSPPLPGPADSSSVTVIL